MSRATPATADRCPISWFGTVLLALLVFTLTLASRAEAFVYWANSDAGSIGRANLNGTSPDQSFITTGRYPGAVAVDGAHIYWSDFGSFNERGEP